MMLSSVWFEMDRLHSNSPYAYAQRVCEHLKPQIVRRQSFKL